MGFNTVSSRHRSHPLPALAALEDPRSELEYIEVTVVLANALAAYYEKKGYVTHRSHGRGGRHGGGSSNTYTASYRIRVHRSGSERAYISSDGAAGSKYGTFYRKHPELSKAYKHRSLKDLYLSLLVRFPDHLLSEKFRSVEKSEVDDEFDTPF